MAAGRLGDKRRAVGCFEHGFCLFLPRSAAETVYPDSLRERLRGFPILADVGDAALRRVLSEANWFGLPGGMLLKRDGENARALFLVVTGSLGVFVEDEERAANALSRTVPA